MPSSPLPITRPVQLGLLLFVALPCLPGFVFLLAGVLRDPHRNWRAAPLVDQPRFDHAWEQTRELYLAGGVVLLVGTACSGFVVWKIVRSGSPPEEVTSEAGSPDEQS